MRNITSLSLLSAILLASFGAQASGTAELEVTGTISPSACVPTLSGGGTIDYGMIAASRLSDDAFTKLPTRELSFSISCDAPIQLAVEALDDRSASVVTDMTEFLTPGKEEHEGYTFGLGRAGGKHIGGYSITLKPGSSTADGVAVDLVHADDGTDDFVKSPEGLFRSDRAISWAASGTTTPGSYKTISGTLSVTAALNKASELSLTGDVPLDGAATLELSYL